MKLLFEISKPGRHQDLIPGCDVETFEFDEKDLRQSAPRLPQLSEVELDRHYSALGRQVHGVNDGPYPLGSCTMKYNPQIDEQMAALEGFAGIHPLQPLDSAQGCLEVLHDAGKLLCEITGMAAMTFQPAAGAHGEYTGLLLIRKYHLDHGDGKRTKIIVPDSAHGTNPASATMAGFEVVNIPSNDRGGVDLEKLREAVGEDTAGLMLTNPNTLGLFDPNILEITRIVHEAGGLCYYDGANMNAIHLNLHKTFATPHGGGGPGAGPVGCKDFLRAYLPSPLVDKQDGKYVLIRPEKTMGQVRSFQGNFLVVVKALTYILTLGREGIIEASGNAVLNANYLMEKLKKYYDVPYGDQKCMHEFVMCLQGLKNETGVSAMDIAKGSLDFGIHPPTMYFPLIVHEALMLEPTETESRESLDEVIDIFVKLHQLAHEDPAYLNSAPHKCAISRPDEVQAARSPILKYEF